MTFDVEGLDLEVIKSNYWNKFKPRMILCEILYSSFENIVQDPVTVFLNAQGYEVYGKFVNTVFYRHKSEMTI